jgi:hypothetical protein
MVTKPKKENAKENLLVYFSNPETDPANADLFKTWARIYKLPAIDGYHLLNGGDHLKHKVENSEKVLLFITDLGETKKYLQRIIECKPDFENVVLFTTHYIKSEMCLYAQEKGIQVILLPFTNGYKLKDFL